mgnify:CR=1 FL=1|jgi:hypothetical protein
MKATSYELRQRAIRADHCDKPTTVTGVTVVPERQKKPQKPINSGFEHCDSKNTGFSVTVVSNLPSTLTGEMAIKLSQRFSRQPLILACFDLRSSCYES